jgi:hypothetical protein
MTSTPPPFRLETATSTPASSGLASDSPSVRPTDPSRQPSSNLPFAFNAEQFSIRSLSESELPYVTGRVTRLQPAPPTDASGIRQYRAENGKLYDHPVRMAQEIFRLLDSYGSGGGRTYLGMAVRNGDRLLADAVHADTAIYFPYQFDFALGGNPNDLMTAPWYSAMAQGQALSAFVRLFRATGADRWKDAADRTFASFTRLGPTSEPWTVFVDRDGYLWLEEYPKDPPMQVLNGHVFALFGLYEYFELTSSETALDLLRGSLTTVKEYGEAFRNPGAVSAYDLRVRYQNAKYHAIHIKQLRLLADITGDPDFLRLADAFEADSPPIEIAESEV